MSRNERNPASAALRQHWPFLVVLLLGALAWADLRGELRDLRESGTGAGGSVPAAPTPAPAPAAQPPQEQPPSRPPDVPTAPADPWACQGAISQEDVRAAVGQHGRAVFACYERRRAEDPTVRGTLTIEARIDRVGQVSDVRFTGALAQDAALGACIRGTTSSWRFAPPTGGACALVSLPFAFGAVPPAGAQRAD